MIFYFFVITSPTIVPRTTNLLLLSYQIFVRFQEFLHRSKFYTFSLIYFFITQLYSWFPWHYVSVQLLHCIDRVETMKGLFFDNILGTAWKLCSFFVMILKLCISRTITPIFNKLWSFAFFKIMLSLSGLFMPW